MGRFGQLPDDRKSEQFARLARRALAAYGLEEARLTHLGEGSHVTFEVQTGDPKRHYALRICRPDWPLNALEREMLWLAALRRQTDLAVPEPILSKDGQLFRKVTTPGVSGRRPCVLVSWIGGASLDAKLGPDHLHALGRFVAGLHTHAQTYRWPDEIRPPPRTTTMIPEGLAERRLREACGAEALHIVRQAVDVIADTLSTLPDGPDAVGPIHGDLRRRHLRFDGTDVGAFGFETCRWDCYAYDLAAVGLWIEARKDGDALAAAFLSGYHSVRDLPTPVERAIPAFALLRSIDTIQSILARFDRSGPAPRELTREFEQLKQRLAAA